MKNFLFLLVTTLALFTACTTPQSKTPPRDIAQARVAQPTDLMESPSSFIVKYRVIEVRNEHIMIVQALGVNYEDEHVVRFSRCYSQGKTPVNVGDTVEVLAEWASGAAGKDGYRRTYPPCQE